MATKVHDEDLAEPNRIDLLGRSGGPPRPDGGARCRVLMLATRVPARPDDGTPGFVLTLATALARSYHVTLLAPRVRGAPSESAVDGVRIVRFGYFPRPWEGLADDAILPTLRQQPWRLLEVPFLVLGFLAATLRLVKRERPDVVNAHWMVPAGLVAMVARFLRGVPYVVTIHGGDAYGLHGGLLDRIKRAVLACADGVAPVSADIARHVPCGCDDTVIPMGVPIERIALAAGPRRPVRGRFLFVGRLVAKKGVDVVLRALAFVPRGRLRIIGDGPQEEALRARATQLGVADRVEFLGRLPNREVLGELAAAQAVVIPSVVAPDGDRDGTPVVLAEAVAAGAPVIASDLGGLGEQIEHGVTGLLVPPGDVVALTAAMRRVLRAPRESERMARRAWRGARGSPLDLATTRARYARIIDEASARGRPARAS